MVTEFFILDIDTRGHIREFSNGLILKKKNIRCDEEYYLRQV
jgi:hypothetical protein